MQRSAGDWRRSIARTSWCTPSRVRTDLVRATLKGHSQNVAASAATREATAEAAPYSPIAGQEQQLLGMSGYAIVAESLGSSRPVPGGMRQHTWPAGHGAFGRFGLARPWRVASSGLDGRSASLVNRRPTHSEQPWYQSVAPSLLRSALQRSRRVPQNLSTQMDLTSSSRQK
jgi:hypothetical protein